MEYRVYELVDNAYVLNKTFKETELIQAKDLLATLGNGHIEKVTDVGSEILNIN